MTTHSESYLETATTHLNTTLPVAPSAARAAQIPLQSFTLPTFPPEAFAADLRSLTLTSDISPHDYTPLLSSPFSVPPLPPSITSLTLELFPVDFPPGIPTALGTSLPSLKSLTLYTQLLAGTTPACAEDALNFIGKQRELRELHLLDVFAPKGFWERFQERLNWGLRFLEVVFTFRGGVGKEEDGKGAEFSKQIQAGEMVGFLRRELVSCTVCISKPEEGEGEGEREGERDGKAGKEEGMSPVGGEKIIGVVMERLALTGPGIGPGNLEALDVTMFELEINHLAKTLVANQGIRILACSVRIDDKGNGNENGGGLWNEVFEAVREKSSEIGILEVVGVPSEGLVERLKEEGGDDEIIGEMELKSLAEGCKRMRSVKVSVLRSREREWVRDEGVWKMVS